MEAQKFTSREYFKALKIVHIALMAGIVFFAVIVFVLLQILQEPFGTEEINGILYYVVPVFVIAGVLASNFLFKARLKKSVVETGLKNKLDSYRSALIVKYALIEGPAFFCIVSYQMTANTLFLVITIFLLVVFWTFRPTKGKAILELELDHDQRRIVENPDAYFE